MALRVITELGNRLLTADELRAPGWSEDRFFAEAPEEGFYELKDGELVMHSPVNLAHQRIAGFLGGLLRCYVSDRDLGEVFQGPAVLKLRGDLLREPDIFFVSWSRREQIHEQSVLAPVELVVEIVSPDSRERDLVEKCREYEAAGIKEYWAIDLQAEKMLVHTRSNNAFERREVADGALQSGAVPGFSIEVEWLWQRPLPNQMECVRQILR